MRQSIGGVDLAVVSARKAVRSDEARVASACMRAHAKASNRLGRLPALPHCWVPARPADAPGLVRSQSLACWEGGVQAGGLKAQTYACYSSVAMCHCQA